MSKSEWQDENRFGRAEMAEENVYQAGDYFGVAGARIRAIREKYLKGESTRTADEAIATIESIEKSAAVCKYNDMLTNYAEASRQVSLIFEGLEHMGVSGEGRTKQAIEDDICMGIVNALILDCKCQA